MKARKLLNLLVITLPKALLYYFVLQGSSAYRVRNTYSPLHCGKPCKARQIPVGRMVDLMSSDVELQRIHPTLFGFHHAK